VNLFLDANICLDLLDTTRSTSKQTVKWYFEHKDDESISFYFSGDFITTFCYIFTEKRGLPPKDVLDAIEELSREVAPLYLVHDDFINAKNYFVAHGFSDFEDLLILQSASRIGCEKFITNDKELLKLDNFSNTKIVKPI
jgi:predicted nucleic acid-binding protein